MKEPLVTDLSPIENLQGDEEQAISAEGGEDGAVCAICFEPIVDEVKQTTSGVVYIPKFDQGILSEPFSPRPHEPDDEPPPPRCHIKAAWQCPHKTKFHRECIRQWFECQSELMRSGSFPSCPLCCQGLETTRITFSSPSFFSEDPARRQPRRPSQPRPPIAPEIVYRYICFFTCFIGSLLCVPLVIVACQEWI